ncbi:hypothetical protein GCM10010109_25630 [Actinoplanes campanulatus]|nr:hypothetical protein GCM10010109_25630 [Actinoplanes campanulatus]GID36727.1 hypothetical protein Aca09nite_32330 [Actinoplanes campanulatus]
MVRLVVAGSEQFQPQAVGTERVRDREVAVNQHGRSLDLVRGKGRGCGPSHTDRNADLGRFTTVFGGKAFKIANLVDAKRAALPLTAKDL